MWKAWGPGDPVEVVKEGGGGRCDEGGDEYVHRVLELDASV